MKILHLSRLALLFCLCLSTPVWAQNNTSFPFNEVQQLTPEQIQIQKYKLQRLRVHQLQGEWFIIRGINEKIDDITLLKMVGASERLENHNQNQLIGNSMALGGLVIMAGGGLMLTDVIKFQNSTLVGIGTIVAGGALALAGEMWAGNIGEASEHLVDKQEAETMVKAYNINLKKELGLEHLTTLD